MACFHFFGVFFSVSRMAWLFFLIAFCSRCQLLFTHLLFHQAFDEEVQVILAR